MSARTAAVPSGTAGSWTGATPAIEGGVVIGFESGEGCIEHFPARHDDDVKAGSQFPPPEQFSCQAFRAITFDG